MDQLADLKISDEEARLRLKALQVLAAVAEDATATPATRARAARALLAATKPPSPWVRPSQAKPRAAPPQESRAELERQLGQLRARKVA